MERLRSSVFVLLAWCLHLLRSEEMLLPANVSQEHIFPTPLILNVNQSVAQWLIEEANNKSKFVSNTSWSDVLSDNATQQMVMRYRERKRQARLMTIQRDILHKLGFTRGPNVTDRLSAEERQSLVQSFDRTMIDRTNSSDEEYEDENNSTTPRTEADTEATNDPC